MGFALEFSSNRETCESVMDRIDYDLLSVVAFVVGPVLLVVAVVVILISAVVLIVIVRGLRRWLLVRLLRLV